MPHIAVADVQQWLETTKMTVASLDAELEASAFALVSAALEGRYTTSAWTNEATTPQLVQTIMSQLVAGWMYNRQYSEESADGSSWGTFLLNYARRLVDSVANGNYELPDVVGSERADFTYPAFWPTDDATAWAETDPTAAEAAPLMFTMGRVF